MPLHQTKKSRNKKMLATCGQTKSARIMALWDGVRTTKEIAEIVGCLPEYVRVVVRQRRGAGSSDIDRRYRASEKGADTVRKRYGRNWAYVASLRKTGDTLAANAAGRDAYRAARKDGLSKIDADARYKAARNRILIRTGNKSAARKAYAKARALELGGV